MHVEVGFPNKETIRTQCRDLVIETGPPPSLGGDPDAIGPFDLLLCALAACTGFGVLTFLDERGYSLADAGLRIDAVRGEETHLLDSIKIEIQVPADFPEKYRDAIVRATDQCLVKHQLGQKPAFEVSVATA